MFARRLRIEIAAALLVCGGLAWLAGARGPVDLAVGAVTTLLAALFVFVVTSFAVARTQSSLAGGFGVRLAEFAATVWTFLVLVPFGGALVRRDPPATEGEPVLLIHGYICNGRAFWSMSRFLSRHGYAAYLHDLEPVYTSIDDYVAGIAARIDEILARTGRRQVAVICHSMGGLALRAYLKVHGREKVAVAITLGTPHHGTRVARTGLGANARQMEPGNPWLAALGEPPPDFALVSLYSADDNVVTPQDSSRVARAENIAMAWLGHLSLLYAEPVFRHVLEVLRRNRSL